MFWGSGLWSHICKEVKVAGSAEGKVELQHSCSRSLNQTQRETEIRMALENYQKGPSHCYYLKQSLGGDYLGEVVLP